MADFKIGNITPLLGNLKAGSTDVIRIMNGAVQVWPIVTPPEDICVTNYAASMVQCNGGALDEYMEGYVELSDSPPISAYFTLRVDYIPGTTSGDCNNPTQQIDLDVEVVAGQSQGLLTCPQAPFINSGGATICSVQLISGTYPECSQPVLDPFVFVIELDNAQPPCQDTSGVAISITPEEQTNIVVGQTLYSTSGSSIQFLPLGFYRMSTQTTLVDGNTYNISTILISNFYIQVNSGGQIISKINC